MDAAARLRAIRDYEASPTLNSQLPIELEGGLVVAALDFQCGRCSGVARYSRGRLLTPWPHLVMGDAFVLCAVCNTLTLLSFRVAHRRGEKPTITFMSGGRWEHRDLVPVASRPASVMELMRRGHWREALARLLG